MYDLENVEIPDEYDPESLQQQRRHIHEENNHPLFRYERKHQDVADAVRRRCRHRQNARKSATVNKPVYVFDAPASRYTTRELLWIAFEYNRAFLWTLLSVLWLCIHNTGHWTLRLLKKKARQCRGTLWPRVDETEQLPRSQIRALGHLLLAVLILFAFYAVYYTWTSILFPDRRPQLERQCEHARELRRQFLQLQDPPLCARISDASAPTRTCFWIPRADARDPLFVLDEPTLTPVGDTVLILQNARTGTDAKFWANVELAGVPVLGETERIQVEGVLGHELQRQFFEE